MPHFSLQRSFWSYHKVQLAVGALIRGRRSFMNLKQPGSYLDIGCGPNMGHDKINLDYNWRPGLDVCCDITVGLSLPDNYAGGIFSEHCIEHFTLPQALSVFCEMRRVLMPGRYIRIIVPDLAIYLDCYRTGRRMPYTQDDKIIGPLSGSAVSINRIMRAHGHQFIYDYEIMKMALEHSGFINITKRSVNEGADPKLLFDTPERAIESLYVEAMNPLDGI
jgi:predicted SAM-dependent methyltransferase